MYTNIVAISKEGDTCYRGVQLKGLQHRGDQIEVLTYWIQIECLFSVKKARARGHEGIL